MKMINWQHYCCPHQRASAVPHLRPECLWLQERFYFGDTVLPLFESGIPLVKKNLKALPDADNITIAYPDEGSWKRFHYQFGEYPEVQQLCLAVTVNNMQSHRI